MGKMKGGKKETAALLEIAFGRDLGSGESGRKRKKRRPGC